MSDAPIRGRQHAPASQYKAWDFLRGEGPSSSEHYHEPLEKKAFKPNWKSKRHQSDIKQDADRLQWEESQKQREEQTFQRRREATQQRGLDHGFNPITGQEYDKNTSSWRTPVDPWAHQKLGLRSTQTIQADQGSSIPAAGVTSHLRSVDRTAALAPVAEMRKERIANGGQTQAQRQKAGGSVKDLMNWGS